MQPFAVTTLLCNKFSLFRQDVKHFFECFCEVVGPKDENGPWIIQKFPESYKDDSVLKSVPEFAFPCEFNTLVYL